MDIKDKIKEISYFKRPLIFLDLETTGLNPQKHEIIEIGALKVKPVPPFEIIEEFSCKIKPQSLQSADKEALKITGYSEAGWAAGIILEEALNKLDEFGKEGILLGYNLSFDWAFLDRAYYSLGRNDPFHYHRLDILSMVYLKFASSIPIEKLSLSAVCEALKIERQSKHRALADALAAYLVFKQLFN